MDKDKVKLFLIVSEDWSFWSHRLSLSESIIKAGMDVTLITKVNSLRKRISEKGINVINVDFVRSSSSPLKDLQNIYKLYRIIKKEKPNIIHNVALKTILIGAIAAYFSKKTIVVNTFTGLGYVFSSEQLKAKIIRSIIKPIFRLIITRSNCWTIFQNPDDLRLFKQLRLISPERSALIRGSGVDVNQFSQFEDLNKTPVVMLASRMLWDKGVGEFVEAAKRIKKENIKVKFILVGGSDVENPMAIPISILEKWNEEGCVIWQGYSDNMPEVLSSASIVCLPSYREGLPKVLLEAAAVGRPLIATDVPGCREIVKNGENGVLVKLKDVDSLYEAIKKLILNNELRKAMGSKSRQIIESEFSADIINKQTLEFYKTALNNKTSIR